MLKEEVKHSDTDFLSAKQDEMLFRSNPIDQASFYQSAYAKRKLTMTNPYEEEAIYGIPKANRKFKLKYHAVFLLFELAVVSMVWTVIIMWNVNRETFNRKGHHFNFIQYALIGLCLYGVLYALFALRRIICIICWCCMRDPRIF